MLRSFAKSFNVFPSSKEVTGVAATAQGGGVLVTPFASEREGNQLPTLYRFTFDAAHTTSDNTGRMIRLENMRLGAKVPNQQGSTYIDTGINTNIDVREGQKIVVGKATIDGSNNACSWC